MLIRATRYAITAALFIGIVLLVRRPEAAGVPSPASASKTGVILVTAALVDDQMQVRPVPLHGMIVATSDGDTISARTGSDGKVTVAVPAGACTIRSVAPALFQGRRYRWALSVRVSAGRTLELALTNDNAAIEESPPSPEPPLSNERVDAAAALYERYAHSVFRIEAGLAHGTGFLADTLGGVIITNAHVVESTEATDLSVVLDTRTRVRAGLLARDSEADIAVIRIHPDHIKGRVPIPLQHLENKAPVVPGERLAAMGYPLHQDLTITVGIASSVRAGAIISDVNINPGNSGGPLLNIDGEAVAVNTFGDVSSQAGPGISGSILMSRAGPALARAAAEFQRTGPPIPDLLPVMPVDRFETATLKAYADTVDTKLYRDFSKLELGPFELTVQTPTQTFVALKVYENEIAKDRKKREARAELPESERYSEVREYRDWGEYVGAPTTPVVSITVIPKVGETGGSVFKRLMLGTNLRATYRFTGDVKGAQVFRNGDPVEPIRGGHSPTKVYVEDRWVSLKDIADQGFYVFGAEILQPDSTGVPPSIVVAVRDLKSPKRLRCIELPAEVIAQAWNDFEGFFQEERPTAGFRRADARAAKKRISARRAGFLEGDCQWPISSDPTRPWGD